MNGSDYIFCAACQRRNAIGTETCVFCGAPLEMKVRDITSTKKMASTFEPAPESAQCVEYLQQLPIGSLALFVMEEDDPIVIRNPETIVLGRFSETGGASVDISSYGPLSRGVSRTHARITCNQGLYILEDLGSTNGTWLNQQRLMPGKLHELHNGDTIMLGALQIMVCFHPR